MLSFQIDNALRNGNEIVRINCDAEGMSVLLKALAAIVGERASHVHLRGPRAGGSELNETTPFGKRAVSEVIIDYVESGTD
jgi:hypothetical protein